MTIMLADSGPGEATHRRPSPGRRHPGSTPPLLRCPFTEVRASREAMTACPGYSPESIGHPSVTGVSPSSATLTCGHLAARPRSAGRYVPVCHHPEADWVTESAQTLLEEGSAGH